ncbi:hypothetical protein E2K80_04500 [Rhodophyticola sp. CCM32]|uniref:calcium-binding protein n=1 Tax=Rhodophyticola sp. CCM32 TaxID=2916397 RepID=UPI00107F3097|nr:hypothetical protein [Rhodophyticola sp. CCM32]QBY00091.1 hypothetical protein E2K80_04500 [Rhodophyticola sp. CCM32]
MYAIARKFAAINVTTDDRKTDDGPIYSHVIFQPARDLTIGDGSHDGYPGGIPSSTEVHGTGGDDEIDHFVVGIGQNLYGFAGDDEITAGYADDRIFGGLGDDTIYANAGDDVVVGDDGNDFLYGEAGNDSIHAGDGADHISGGIDDDFIFLIDDGDVDIVYFLAGDGHDVIDNFELGTDQVALGNFGFTSFDQIDALITYSADQALLDLGNGDTIIFTGLDGSLGAEDFVF